MKACTSSTVGFSVAGTLVIVSNGTTSYLMNLLSSSISVFILTFDSLRLSNYPSITSLVDLHRPTFVSCLASLRSIECRMKSLAVIYLIYPTLFGFSISIVQCLVFESGSIIDKVFYFLALTIVDSE